MEDASSRLRPLTLSRFKDHFDRAVRTGHDSENTYKSVHKFLEPYTRERQDYDDVEEIVDIRAYLRKQRHLEDYDFGRLLGDVTLVLAQTLDNENFSKNELSNPTKVTALRALLDALQNDAKKSTNIRSIVNATIGRLTAAIRRAENLSVAGGGARGAEAAPKQEGGGAAPGHHSRHSSEHVDSPPAPRSPRGSWSDKGDSGSGHRGSEKPRSGGEARAHTRSASDPGIGHADTSTATRSRAASVDWGSSREGDHHAGASAKGGHFRADRERPFGGLLATVKYDKRKGVSGLSAARRATSAPFSLTAGVRDDDTLLFAGAAAAALCKVCAQFALVFRTVSASVA